VRNGQGIIAFLREEVASLRATMRNVPEPELNWDVLGIRRHVLRAWRLLLEEHGKPHQIAIAVFVGVLIGSSPFYGFHIVLCVALGVVLRLNKLAILLASNVSLPVIAPFIAFASIQVGSVLLDGKMAEITVEGLRSRSPFRLLVLWFVGFPIVGGLLGLALGGITYRVLRLRAIGKPPP
jgi:uncharacterized protein (DUF2062 family)